jgi:hypothetical protein
MLDRSAAKKIKGTVAIIEGKEVPISIGGSIHADDKVGWILTQLPTETINALGQLHADAEESEEELDADDIDSLITAEMAETIGMPRDKLIAAIAEMEIDNFHEELVEREEIEAKAKKAKAKPKQNRKKKAKAKKAAAKPKQNRKKKK